MIGSNDTSHWRRVARGAAVAVSAAGWLFACATVVEDPMTTDDVNTSAGLASGTGGVTSTTSSTNSAAHTASTALTSAVTTAASLSASSAVTTGEATTSTSSSGSNTTSTAAASNTASNGASSSTTASSSNGTGGSTTGSFATTVTDGTGGSTASTTSVTTSTTGGTTEYCDDARTPEENVAAEGTTGSFATKDGVCYRLDFVPAAFAGWGCSNFEAQTDNRTITVNGTSVTCGDLPLPEPVDGGYYFEFGAGTNVSASMYWWNWE